MGHWVSLHAALCMVMADGAHYYLLSHFTPICGPCLGHLRSSGAQLQVGLHRAEADIGQHPISVAFPLHTPLQASQSLRLFDMCLILCPLSPTGSHTDSEQVSALFSKKPVLSDQSPTRGGLPICLAQRLFTSQLNITDG